MKKCRTYLMDKLGGKQAKALVAILLLTWGCATGSESKDPANKKPSKNKTVKTTAQKDSPIKAGKKRVEKLAKTQAIMKDQWSKSRVKEAFAYSEQKWDSTCKAKGLHYPLEDIFLRAEKATEKLELYARNTGDNKYKLVATYEICATSGELGPKRKEGDGQVPEGIYEIRHFNPQSDFYLSMGISYPNASDKVRSNKKQPGGAIYMHGSCVTIGCIPITDDKIKEVYWACVQWQAANPKSKIRIEIYPTALTDSKMEELEKEYVGEPEKIQFWKELKPYYQAMEDNKVPRKLKINSKGAYE